MWSYFWLSLGLYSSVVILAVIFSVSYLSRHEIGPYDQCSIS